MEPLETEIYAGENAIIFFSCRLTFTNVFSDYFGEGSYLASVFQSDSNINSFMDTVVAPALGIADTVKYDGQREAAVRAFRSSYMRPIVDKGR